MSLSSRFARMKPFSGSGRGVENEDLGEAIDSASVAGGGNAVRRGDKTKSPLRVSSALKGLLSSKGLLSEQDLDSDVDRPTAALQALIDRPHIDVPAEVIDRSHPLPEYFISSSHNTYLMAHQLYGASSAAAYELALNTGSRCVEIDAWDNDEQPQEPKVTHGYTLVSHISFRAVCETIRDVVDKEQVQSAQDEGYHSSPIILSLENHCGPEGQARLVQIMTEVWGDRLLSQAVRKKGHEEQEGAEGPHQHVSLDELGSKIVVIVEYPLPDEVDDRDDDDSSASEGEDEQRARKEYKEKRRAVASGVIIPELAAIGVYAQSVKPRDNSWFESSELKNGPHHHLINVSEVGLRVHMPGQSESIARHNAQHLMRVFPKGTRISSKNLNPVPFWGIGAQFVSHMYRICALNWQTFGASMQLNYALFNGSEGYVLKPAALRAGGNGKLNTGKTKKLRLQVGGATDVPVPEGRDATDIKPYVTCTLMHPDDIEETPPKRKTKPYKQHKLDFLHKGENPPVTEPIWDETLEWEYKDNDMVFLRILIKSDDKFAGNPVLVAAAVRVAYLTTDWCFIQMLDLKGRETKCSLLVKFGFEDV